MSPDDAAIDAGEKEVGDVVLATPPAREGREVFARQKADRQAGTTTRRPTTGSFLDALENLIDVTEHGE